MRRPATSMGLQLAVTFLLLAWAPSLAVSSQRQQLKAVEERERKLLDELESLEKQVDRLEDRLAWGESKIRALNLKISGGDKERKELDRRMAELEKTLARRLRAIYLMRDGGLLQVLLQARSFSDLVTRYRHLSLIMARDREALTQYGETRIELKTKKETLEANKADLLAANKQLDIERDKLTDTLHDKTNLLMQVHRKKELYLAMLARQEKARQKLVNSMFVRRGAENAPEALIDPPVSPVRPVITEPVEEKKAEKFADFTRLKGKIPFPARGRVKKKFGPVSGSTNTYKNGLLLSVRSGSDVQTVVDGRIIYVGWLNGFGNIVIVDHGNRYYSLTGGLSGLRFKTGDWVRQGEVLGIIPRTGANSKKDIYFEIRHGGRAIDPLPWLRKTPG